MNLYLKDPAYPRWPMHNPQVKEAFGLPLKAKWPAEGLPKREIQGITCWVEPMAAPIYAQRYGKTVKVKSSKHRTFGICPACNATIPLGRMEQHSKVHTA